MRGWRRGGVGVDYLGEGGDIIRGVADYKEC